MGIRRSAAVTTTIAAAIVITALLCGAAISQQTYPTRPVRVVVGVSVGQSTDILARLLANSLSKSLGQNFVVDNKPGAGATLGPAFVAKAAPDGYTVLVSSSGPLAIVPALQKNLSYDPVKDFVPIGNAFMLPVFLVVNRDLPVSSVSEFVAYAKARPGVLNYASAGNGTTGHLAMEMFMSATGVKMVHVAYKGTPVSIIDLIGGVTQAVFDFGPVVVPQARADKVKVLGVASLSRSRVLPAVPTVASQGLQDFEAGTFIGLFAPAGTPAPIVELLNAEMGKALKDPQTDAALRTMAGEIAGGSPADMAALLQKELAVWGKVIRDANIKLE